MATLTQQQIDAIAAKHGAPVGVSASKPITVSRRERLGLNIPKNDLQTDVAGAGNVPVIKQLSDFGVGIGTSIGKTGLGAGEALLKFAKGAGDLVGADTTGAQEEINAIKKIRENVYEKPFEKQTKTILGQTGSAVGTIAPYIATAGAVNPATAHLPAVQRILARTFPDMLMSSAQSSGDAKATAGGAITSLVGNALFPGGGKIVQGVKGNAKQFVKGLIPGYTADVTGGLSGQRGEERTGGKAFIPGAGTALAGVISGVSTGANIYANSKNPELKFNKISAENEKNLSTLEDSYSTVRKSTDKAKSQGIDAKKILSQTDLLNNSVDETGTIRTSQEGGAISKLNDFIQPQEDVISKNLKREGVSIPLSEVKSKMIESINSSGIKGAAKIRALNQVADEINGYMTEADDVGRIPLAVLHDAKVDKYKNLNYFNPESKTIDKTIARTLKEVVETNTKSVAVQQLNKELQAHYSVLNLLEKLDGKKVEGGKLGKYFAKTVGAIVGSHFGPLGSIIGAETAGKIKGMGMKGAFSDETGNSLERSDAMKNAVRQGNSPRLGLPAPAEGATNVSNYVPIEATGASSMEGRAAVVNNKNTPVPERLQLPEGRKNVVSGETIRLPTSARESALGLDEVRNMKSGYSNNLGNRNMSQSTTIAPTSIDMPNTIPHGADKPYTPTEIIDHHFNTNMNALKSMIDSGDLKELNDAQKLEMLQETLADASKSLKYYGQPELADKILKINPAESSSMANLWNKVKNVLGDDLPNKQGGFVKIANGANVSSNNMTHDFVAPKDIKIYRGQGKGIGNSTYTKGQYFADSKEFASAFGDNITTDVIPKGTKIFDFDVIKKNEGQSIIPKQILIDPDVTRQYLIDQGYTFTKNTNTRGVEYVKLINPLEESPIFKTAMSSKDYDSFNQSLLDDWGTYRDDIESIDSKFTGAQRMRSNPREYIWQQAQQLKDAREELDRILNK